MWGVWWRVRAGLRQGWRVPVALALITALVGAAVLVALAGARRTDTAVSRFRQYAGPSEGQVLAGSRHTLDKRELAILKAVGFAPRQVRAAVAWQATAIAVSSLIIGMPVGIAVGRWAWTLLATTFAIEPVPVISPLVLLAFPAVLVLANVVAAFPARTAAHTQPATLLRAE